jgi:hypothetical protein
MTSEEWPIWMLPERGSHAPALRAGRHRLPTVRADFFLDERSRLTEQERALMTGMLHRLVDDVAVEIQTALPEDWLPANDDSQALVARLSAAKLLDIERVFELLLHRADEERVSLALVARSARPARNLIQPFVSHENADVAAAAMAVLIARGRRRDRYRRPLIELNDVDAESARALVFAVAAGLWERIQGHVPAGNAETRLYESALLLLEGHDTSKSLDFAMDRLVRALLASGALDDSLLVAAIDAADISFLAQALAVRANIPSAAAFNELMSSDPIPVMLLLRMANASTELAAHLVATLGDLIGLAADAQNLDRYTAATAEQQAAGRAWLQLDPSFQTALRHLGHGHGHSTL